MQSSAENLHYVFDIGDHPTVVTCLPIAAESFKLKSGLIRVLLAPMISRDHFFLAVFVRVTHDGQSDRGTSRSLGIYGLF